MKRSTDRILTTHVGSLPRPAPLADMLLKKERGEAVDERAFDRMLSSAVNDIVARQVETGIDAVSDGEFGKIGYSTYVKDRLTGFEGDTPRKAPKDLQAHPWFVEATTRMTGRQMFRRASCTGPVKLKERSLYEKDLANFKAAVARSRPVDAFLTAASPGVVTAFQPNAYYPTHEAYAAAVGEAMKEEYEAIVKAGFVLQLDCPDVAMARHTAFQDISDSEFLKRAECHIEVLNGALAGIPAESVRVHICWGNYEGPHDYDIPVERVLGIVLRAKAAAFSFEGANPRHEHEWEVWRDAKIPEDKVLIPGVLDSTSNFVEHPRLVAQRIRRWADIVGRERVIAGSDCGFGTFAGYGKMDPDITFKKLAAMIEGARMASKELWG
jgi:5-methyltetrahydropteroyltriglutamate--homocysteine methyltransferase